jgi:hypothetical protein
MLQPLIFLPLLPCLPMLPKCFDCYGYAKTLVVLQLQRCPTLFNIYFYSQIFGGTQSEKVRKQSTKFWLDPGAVRVEFVIKSVSGRELPPTIFMFFSQILF